MKYLEHLVNMDIFKRIMLAKKDVDRASNCHLLFINKTNKVFAYVKTKRPFTRLEVFKRNCQGKPITIDSFQSFASFQKCSTYDNWEIYQSDPELDSTPLDLNKFIKDTGFKHLERLTNHRHKAAKPAVKRLYQITASSTSLEFYVYESESYGNKALVSKVRRTMIARASSLIGNERNIAINKDWLAIRKAFLDAKYYTVKIMPDLGLNDMSRGDRSNFVRQRNKSALMKASL